MKKRILASLLSLCLLVGLFPTAALAADNEPDGETPVVCAELVGCVEDAHDEGCPLYVDVAPEEDEEPGGAVCTCEALCAEGAVGENCPVCAEDYALCEYVAPADEGDSLPCALTEGCTLEAGHEGECVFPDEPEEPTAEEQLAALIAALPAPDEIDPEDEEQVEEVNGQLSEIYAFAEENGLDVEDNETINAMIAALHPAELLATEENEVAIEFSDANSPYAGEYLISTKESLDALSKAVNGGNTMQNIKFYLHNDIILNDGHFSANEGSLYYTPDQSDTAYPVNIENASYGDSKQLAAFVPIGFQAKTNDTQWEKNGFAGEFYGNGYEIKGLFVNGNDANAEAHYKGLFGALLTGGKISDLTVSGCVYGAGSNLGGIVGKSWGCIDNCHFSGVVMGAYNAGGIVGETASIGTGNILQNCTNTAHISAGTTAANGGNWGGIVGCANGVSIQNCINYGAVTSNNFVNVGGIIGVGNAAISACINWGSITGPKSSRTTGGVAGNHNTGATSLNFICITTADELEKYTKTTRPNHAKWAVALYLDGGSFDGGIVVSSDALVIPTKENQIFGGWYVNSDLSGEAATTLETGKIYYAKWNSTITFDANGGTGSMNAQTIGATDTTTTLTANTFTKTGYTFDKWNTKADGTGTNYAAGATGAGANGHTTLYAQWKPNTYTISFNGGSGDSGSTVSGSTTSVTATYDQPATLTANGFTKSNFIFAGWDTDSSADEVVYSDGAQIKNLTDAASGTVTLYAVWTTKEVLNPTLTVQEKTYNGEEQAFALDGNYQISYQQNGQTATPKNAGTYDVVVSTDETQTTAAYHNTVYGGLVIKPAPLTITANDKTIYIGDELPEFTYAVSGLVNNETESVVTSKPTLTCSADGKAAGTFDITLSGAEAGANYEISYVSGTLTVRNRSTAGGSSSGSSSSTTTETTSPDGSKTTIVTDKKTGTVTETTKFKDGSTLVVETKKDGTVTTTETAANGVKVKTVDAPREDVTATVTIPRSVGEATVSIPADVTPGTVAVDAKTGKIVKLSVPTEDGLTVKLDGSADLILVDNSKGFTDTRNHWAEDAIDFATAHEMFSGTSETTFTPDAPMTRAMLMTVLARFDGQDTTGGSVWYEKGMEWAKENGVSDGTNPNGNITREQFAAMLYRYAGSPNVVGDIDDFSDGGKVSGYADQAMRWAVSTGIIGGMGDGTLAPQGNATRAQVATMLQRFVGNLTK